jgi:hypothetical protein
LSSFFFLCDLKVLRGAGGMKLIILLLDGVSLKLERAARALIQVTHLAKIGILRKYYL